MLSFARITAQSGAPAAFLGGDAAPAPSGTSAFGGWHDSFPRYSESVRQTRPAIGSELAGCSDDHISPTETPPAGAPADAPSCEIQSRAACAAFSESPK